MSGAAGHIGAGEARVSIRERVVIENRADGGVLYWTAKLYGFALLVIGAGFVVTGALSYRHYTHQVPTTPDLAEYATSTPQQTMLYAGDGTPLGRLAGEHRSLIAYDQIPEQLVRAFLAAEDHRYFDHRGIDLKGVARAFLANMTAGDFAQGGSTITQQVAKHYLGSDKSLSRKIREAILARRLERAYSKKAILAIYLNHIYLGSGAYGIEAAARTYFSKELDELELGEMATLAGLAKAPSRYSPTRYPERARKRRDEVLRRMARYGFVDREAADRAQSEPLDLDLEPERLHTRMPYFAEHVRRYLADTYGAEHAATAGWRVETTVDPVVESHAYANADFGARRQDKRQGWRGAEAHLEGKARDTFVRRAMAEYGDRDLIPKRRYLGLVEKVEWDRVSVRVGARLYQLMLDDMRWAARWETRGKNDEHIWRASQALQIGDVIWVSQKTAGQTKFNDWVLDDLFVPQWQKPEEPSKRQLERSAKRVTLEQAPHPQMAILTADHQTGYVVSMVGGTDYSRSEYNRATQACRQPGSTYKPIYYSAALDLGFGFDSRWDDTPFVEVDPVTGQEWRPENLGGSSDHDVSLEYALVFSKNLPSVHIFKEVGAEGVAAWARRLGFTTEIIADLALALGASCTRLDELTRAFAIFARHGKWIDWKYVRRIYDRDGGIVEDNTVAHDPMLSPGDRYDRMFATAGAAHDQVIPPRTAFLMDKLLGQEVRHGFAKILRDTGVHGAGKTGTSSATMDTSFVGYTSRWISSVWMGDDLRQRPLGLKDAAFQTVVPVWSRFMVRAAEGHPNREIPWTTPPGVNPDDRGGRKGKTGGPMDLHYRWPERKIDIEMDDEQEPDPPATRRKPGQG